MKFKDLEQAENYYMSNFAKNNEDFAGLERWLVNVKIENTPMENVIAIENIIAKNLPYDGECRKELEEFFNLMWIDSLEAPPPQKEERSVRRP